MKKRVLKLMPPVSLKEIRSNTEAQKAITIATEPNADGETNREVMARRVVQAEVHDEINNVDLSNMSQETQACDNYNCVRESGCTYDGEQSCGNATFKHNFGQKLSTRNRIPLKTLKNLTRTAFRRSKKKVELDSVPAVHEDAHYGESEDSESDYDCGQDGIPLVRK